METETGVVAVDTPFTVSEARALRRELESLKKPLLAVLLTHAHPDHVNGTGILRAGSKVPVVATEATLSNLRAIDGPKREYWKPKYGAEYPDSTVFPDRTVRDGEEVSFGGARFRVVDLGSGESESQTAFILDGKAAFVGDLVVNGVHAWLAEGRSRAWIGSLRGAQRQLTGVVTIYPGHGKAGGAEILETQVRYIETYRAAVKKLAAGGSVLDDAKKAALEKQMDSAFPGAGLKMLVGFSADAVARELASEK